MSEFVRVPADSTGKRLRHIRRMDLLMTSTAVDLDTLELDDVITGATSTDTGYFHGYSVTALGTVLYISSPTGDFTAGENITIGATTVGVLTSTTDSYTQAQLIVDADNPDNTLQVSKEGSAFIRFHEGEMNFDSFGGAQVSQRSIIQQYSFLYGDTDPTKFWDRTVGAGVITGSSATSQLILSVDATSGSVASRTTQQYFPYSPGEGNQAYMSVKLGDTGKDGVVRRWGAFDADDGLFFEASGSEMCVVQRSSATGTVTENKVLQSDWNGDNLDDANLDSYVINVSKFQVYWIDYQWLGAGKVRFGVFAPDGERIIMHTFFNANNSVNPYMKRGTLPLRSEIENVAASSGASDMSVICLTMFRQAQLPSFTGRVFHTHSTNNVAVSSSDWIPLMTIRPKTTYGGVTNRAMVVPMDFEVYVDGDPVDMATFISPNLTGSAFGVEKGAFDIDISATNMNGGTEKDALMFGSGVTLRKIRDADLNNSIGLTAQGVALPITIAAKVMKSSGTANVNLMARWREIH